MASHPIAIITDSTCDIPSHLVEQYDIRVLPHLLVWKGQQYRDGVEITPQVFYERLSSEKEMPTSTYASAQDYANLYRQVQEQGAREIVVLVINRGLSAAFYSATLAAKQVNLPVYVHDSRGLSMGLGWQVLAAARAREQDCNAMQMLSAAEDVRGRIQMYTCLDTIEYLYRGGRIGNARRLIGNVLGLKPVIYLDHTVGQIAAAGVAPNRERAIDLMYHKFFASINIKHRLHIAVMHGNAAQEAEVLAQRVQAEYAPVEIICNITCPVLGLHTGPQAMALIGYSE